MKFKQFKKEYLNEEILDFEDFWKQEHKNDPEGFPKDLDQFEWFEQFILFMKGRHTID